MANVDYEETEYKFPDEQEEEELAAGGPIRDTDAIEVVEQDDTPQEDQGREPLDEETLAEIEADEPLENYSKKHKQRLAQMKHAIHDERRAKEAVLREREQAVELAKQAMVDNHRLRQTLSQGEGEYARLLQEAAIRELNDAKRTYKDAYEAGDSEAIVSAQELMTNAQHKARTAFGYIRQYAAEENARQTQEIPVNSQIQEAPVAAPDDKAVAWHRRNPWFGSDDEMTAASLGLDSKLRSEGLSPSSDEYYRRINSTMRRRFPEYEWGDAPAGNPSRAKPTVVAPASRSTAPKRVVLTTSAMRLASRLGLTPEQYAREQAKLNGA